MLEKNKWKICKKLKKEISKQMSKLWPSQPDSKQKVPLENLIKGQSLACTIIRWSIISKMISEHFPNVKFWMIPDHTSNIPRNVWYTVYRITVYQGPPRVSFDCIVSSSTGPYIPVLNLDTEQSWPGLKVKVGLPGRGRGVYMTQPFRKGDVICDYHGQSIEHSSLKAKED